MSHETFAEWLRRCPGLAPLLEEVEQVARTRDAVLLLGETGTGKEVVARALHQASSRRDQPLVSVNCAELEGDLVRSELFGHAKGAFTGAIQDRPGLIRSADGGTLFLDEFGELPIEVQSKLLRVLEEQRVRPVGGDKDHPVNVRFIAATSRDVEALIAEGRFRLDTVSRFACKLRIPPLRERRGDIAPLVHHFIETLRDEEGRNPKATALTPEALALLERAAWPGNVRELQHAIRRALTRSAESRVDVLGVEFFEDLLLPGGTSGEPEARAIEALRTLASAVLDELEAGQRPPATIPKLEDQFDKASFGYQLAAEFVRRYQGEAGKAQARRLFGYGSHEAILKRVRSR